MLKTLRNNRAQAVMGEYVVVIFLVVTVIVAMTVYFKRAVQARVHEARDYMIDDIRTRTVGEYGGVLLREYEPYYANTITRTSSSSNHTSGLLAGPTSGIFVKTVDDVRTVQTNSVTLPPRDADLTTPTN